jgi:glycosyltransferase involved in cell wall biosynthesis
VVAILGYITRRNKTKLIVVDHINVSNYFKSQNLLYSLGIKILMKTLYPLADIVGGVSRGVLEDVRELVKLPKSKTKVLHNPVVSKKLYEDAHESPKHTWIHNQENKVVLGAGRLHPQKNFPLLIRAFSKAQAHDPNLRLIILGEGKQRPELESIISEFGLNDAVTLQGHVSNPYSYMAHADLFALSSDFEGFGNVVAEALACGCPVVSTDCRSGPREILEDGKWGTLVPVGDADALSTAMIESLNREHNREAYKKRGAMFSVERSVDEYEKVIIGG